MIPFLFAPESPRPWALMRIVLASALVFEALGRWPFAVELYSTAGFPFPAFPSANFQPAPADPFLTVILYSSLVVLLLLLLVGWHSRLCAVLAFGLSGWFALLDAAGTLTKYSAISLHLLLLMSLARPGAVWSVDTWIRRRRGKAVPLASAWPRWLARLLVASIYLGAAVTKIRLPDFATGDLLEFSLLDDAFGGRWLGHWLSTRPKLLILASFATIAFELLFPVLVWVPRLRRPMLVCATAFHLSLTAMMHLEIFTPIMLAALCAFLKEEDLQAVQSWLPGRSRSRDRQEVRSPSRKLAPLLEFVLFGLITAGLVAGLSAYQYRQDVYGVFHRTIEVEFPPVDPEQAYAMIDAYEPEARDYFHRIEIGSRLGYRHVYGEHSRFRPGQAVYVMARLLQPHPSWDLEWELIPPRRTEDEQPAAASYLRRLDASHSYASIGFQLKEDFPEGRYLIRLSVSERLGTTELIKEIPFELVRAE